jgi:hypothetical protein
MLPPFWQTVSLFNPVVYLISAFRWSFFGTADVAIGVSLAAIAAVHRSVHHHHLVDFQNRLSLEKLKRLQQKWEPVLRPKTRQKRMSVWSIRTAMVGPVAQQDRAPDS